MLSMEAMVVEWVQRDEELKLQVQMTLPLVEGVQRDEELKKELEHLSKDKKKSPLPKDCSPLLRIYLFCNSHSKFATVFDPVNTARKQRPAHLQWPSSAVIYIYW